jgi:hypothetical protein
MDGLVMDYANLRNIHDRKCWGLPSDQWQGNAFFFYESSPQNLIAPLKYISGSLYKAKVLENCV